MTHVLVLCGGEIVPGVSLPIEPAEFVVAADSGILWAGVLNVQIDLVVGDMDSASPEMIMGAEARGAALAVHPAMKDETDLELAMREALTRGATHLTVVGGGGGRLDHLMGNLGLFARDDFAGVELTAYLPPATITVVRQQTRTLVGQPGDYVSLLAMHGDAKGVTGVGFLWPLDGQVLEAGATLGVSNELLGERASVVAGEGVVLAIQPGIR